MTALVVDCELCAEGDLAAKHLQRLVPAVVTQGDDSPTREAGRSGHVATGCDFQPGPQGGDKQDDDEHCRRKEDDEPSRSSGHRLIMTAQSGPSVNGTSRTANVTTGEFARIVVVGWWQRLRDLDRRALNKAAMDEANRTGEGWERVLLFAAIAFVAVPFSLLGHFWIGAGIAGVMVYVIASEGLRMRRKFKARQPPRPPPGDR